MKQIICINEETDSVKYLISKDKRLAKLFHIVGPISYTLYEDSPYSFLVNTIIGQMLSNKVADILSNRVNLLCHGNVCPEQISKLSIEELRSVGISYSKIKYIFNLTDAIRENKLHPNHLTNLTDQQVIEVLTSIQGIGQWSAKMYLIFVLNRSNVLPYEDAAFKQAYSWLYKTTDLKPSSIQKKCAKWSPYSSIAARYLYHALDSELTKEPFHLHK